MFGIGATEFAIILIFSFLIFGPDKLPQIAKTIGRAVSKFKDAQSEMNEVIKTEVYDPATDKENPFQKPLDTLSKLDKTDPVKTESFAERKARYDRERAECKAAETQTEGKQGEAAATTAKPEPAASRPVVSADELYGNVSKASNGAAEPAATPAKLAQAADAPAGDAALGSEGGE